MSKALLTVQQLTKFFIGPQDEKFCLWKDIYFDVYQGESMAICGESGSGKTTLLFALGGLESLDAGEIHLDGQSLTYGKQAYVPGLSYIFQHYYLIEELSILDNVCMPILVAGKMTSDHTVRALQLLRELGLEPFAHRPPKNLSGGERQRVAICRALITQPKLILADEPTGSLDEQTSEQVMQMFFSVCQKLKTSIILVTHNERFAAKTTHHYQLKQGRLTICE